MSLKYFIQKFGFIVILVVIVLGVVVYSLVTRDNSPDSTLNTNTNTNSNNNTRTNSTTPATNTALSSTSGSATNVTTTNSATNTATSRTGQYTDYQTELFARAENSRVVIVFLAGYDPTSQILEEDLKNKSSVIPADLTIMKANFEEKTNEASRYGVISPATVVQIDKNGNLLRKQAGLLSLQDINSFAKAP
jgi:hypothetical protein